MSAIRTNLLFLRTCGTALTIIGIGALVLGAKSLRAQGSPGAGADSCGPASVTPPTGSAAAQFPIFPPGEYPVKLPAMSLLGAPNNLPIRIAAGVDWGQLPEGQEMGIDSERQHRS